MTMHSITLTTYLKKEGGHFTDPLAAILAIGPNYQTILEFWAHLDTVTAARWNEESAKWGAPANTDEEKTTAVKRWQVAAEIVNSREDSVQLRGGQLPDEPVHPGSVARAVYAYKDSLTDDLKTKWNLYGLLRMATLELLLHIPRYSPFFLTLIPDLPEKFIEEAKTKGSKSKTPTTPKSKTTTTQNT